MNHLLAVFLFSIFSQTVFALDCPSGTKESKRTSGESRIEECLSEASGKPEGPTQEYDSKGTLRRSSSYKNGKLEGEFKVYDSEKRLIREGVFQKGLLQGKVRRFYSNGQLQDETPWVDGRPHGNVIQYHRNGKVKEKGLYRTGLRAGVWQYFKENGQLASEKDHGNFRETRAVDWMVPVVAIGPRHGISWVKQAAVEVRETRQGDYYFVARVQAQAPEPGWVVSVDDEDFQSWDSEEKFITVDLPLTGPETVIQAIARSEEHEGDTYQLTVSAPDYDSRLQALISDPPRSSYFLLGASLNSTKYTEGTSVDSSMNSAGLLAVYRNVIVPPRYDLDLSIAYSGVPLSKSGDEPPAYLSLNARLGVILSGVSDRWTVSMMGGVYSRMALASAKNYGFGNLTGPQLYPYISRRIGQKQLAFGYFKYSPIFNGNGLLSSSDRELAGGLGWMHTLRSGNVVGLLVDYTNLEINSFNIKLKNQNASLSLAYGF